MLWVTGKIAWYKNTPVVFEQDKWRAAEKENNANSTYIRLRMATNIIETVMLNGKTQTEVVALLGTPQNHPDVPGSAYWLSPFGLDSMWLQIIYKNGIATSVQITND